jgi:regulatory protein YycI of two-component signal transduction system YycFG
MKFILSLVVIGFIIRWIFQNARVNVTHVHIHRDETNRPKQDGEITFQGKIPEERNHVKGTDTPYEEIE